MLPIPIPTEPWRFAGGRVWLDDVVAKGHDDTLQYLQGCRSNPIDDSRKVNEKTEAYRKYARRLWDMFCKTVLSMAGPEVIADPDAIILDLCYNRTSAEDKFRAFLRYYVKTSVQLRPSLGPEEYEWVRDVDSAITVTELWKALVREFDCGFLQTMRRQEPEKVSLYSLKFCDTSQGAGSVWKVSKWIREDLADELGLSRGQLFHKQEVTGEDALAILSVLWARPDVVTCKPAERLAFHFMVLLASIGAFRPGALDHIRYKQVQLAIVADPVDNSRRLVATITIIHNKTDKNALKRSQDDRISFSVTFAPCPIVCVLSLLIAKAIKDDAFDVGFDCLDDLLSRPTLGDLTYLPIHWKGGVLENDMFELPYHRLWEIWNSCTWALGCREPLRPYAMRVGSAGRLDGVLTPAVRNFVVDNSSEVFEKSYLPNHFRGQLAKFAFGALAGDYEPLFRQLCNASLKVDANAPMNVTLEEKAAFEQRQDLRAISIKLADDSEGEAPGWRDELHSRASYIRRSLTKQFNVQKRKRYFEQVDRQQALGINCAPSPAGGKTSGYQNESCPFEGAADIGSVFRHFSATQDLRPATLKVYSKLLVAYLRRMPAEVVHLAYAAIRDAAVAGPNPATSPLSLAEPPLRSRASASTSWCLLGCGSFSRRPGLTRHMKLHDRDGSFAKPFNCPECRRLNWPASIIESTSHWSAHVEVHHDERDAPNLVSSLSPAKSPDTPVANPAAIANCFFCNRNFKAKGLYIHYHAHKKDPRWQNPFGCPECKRLGQLVIVDNFEAWRKHSNEVHGNSGVFLEEEACFKAEKRFLEDTEAERPPSFKRMKVLEGRESSQCPANKNQLCDSRLSNAFGDRYVSPRKSMVMLEHLHAGSKSHPIVL